MPVDLPGYYYDASKSRYFKITANHIARGSSSTNAAQYSRQAVQAQHAADQSEQREKLLKASKDAVTVTRSKLLLHPLLNFEPRLGSRKKSAASTVKEFYAASLSGRPATPPEVVPDGAGQVGLRNFHGQFAVDEETGLLFTYADFVGQRADRAACFLQPEEDSPILYPRGQPISDLPPAVVVTRILCLGRSGVNVWAWHHLAGRIEDNSSLCVTRGSFEKLGNTVDYGATMMYQLTDTVHDLAAAPGQDAFAAVDSRHVTIRWPDLGTAKEVFSGPHSGRFSSVWFKDNNVILCGARSGQVKFADLRAPAKNKKNSSSVTRIQHDSAVSHVRTIGAHQVLAHGLTSTSLYDLRWCPQPSMTMTMSRPAARDDHRPSPHKSSSQQSKPTYKATQPYLTFDVPSQRRQNRDGLGFAYDAELNVVMGATTDFHRRHRVNLWDASTGHLLQSPLLHYRFKDPVTCAHFVDVRPQAKSLLLAADGVIQEWSPL